MSDRAFSIFRSLRDDGVDEAVARKAAEAAEAIDAQGDQNAESRFVGRGEYGRRMENTPTRTETNAHFDQLRAEISATNSRLDSLYRVLLGILLSTVGGFVAVIGGLAAVIVKLFGA